MRKSLVRSLGSLAIAFIIIVIGKYVIVAQDVVTGEWKTETWNEKHDKEGKQVRSSSDGKIHLSFQRTTANGRNSHGSSFTLEELGLTAAQVQNGRVSFRLVREAGTIDAEGNFVAGNGSGTFRFTPNRTFIDAMRSRGFDFERAGKHGDTGSEKLLSAAFVNVTVALADDLNAANFGKLDVDDLFKAAIFKIDGKFMAEMKATGFPDLQMEDLVKARIFKIDADYVRQVYEMGFSNRDFEGLVKFRIFNVTPEYLAELKAAGLTKLDGEEIVKCKIFNIDPEFVRKARAEDPNVTLEELVRMKIGVGKKKTI
jgi:hypothetical protein